MGNLKRDSRVSGCGLVCGALLLTVLNAEPAFGQGTASHESFRLACGYSARTFVDVGFEDAKVVTKFWTDMLAKKKNGTAEVMIYQTLTDIERDLKAQKVDILALVPNEFIELKGKLPVEPAVVTSDEKSPYVKVLLLARKDKNIRQAKDLINKNVVLANGQFSTIYQIWFETLLIREGWTDSPESLLTGKAFRKPKQAVMSVFFQQADACVVNQSTFQVMTELNPQVGRELRVLAESPDLAGGVIAFRKDYNEIHKETVREILATMHTDPKGKQLLTLFQIHKLVPYRSGDLDSMEALLKEHRRLKIKNQKAGS